MIKKKRLMEMMADFMEIWPREVTPRMVDIYFETIKDAKFTEEEDIETAFKLILATNKYKFPDPSAFVDALGGSPAREFMTKLAYFKDI